MTTFRCVWKSYLVIGLLFVATANAEIYVKLLNPETLKRLKAASSAHQQDSQGVGHRASLFSALRLGAEVANDADDTNDDMEEEIIAEDEDGNMFLLVSSDLLDSNALPTKQNKHKITKNRKKQKQKIKVEEEVVEEDPDDEEEVAANDDAEDEVEVEEANDANADSVYDDAEADAGNEEADDDEDALEDTSDDIGRGHKKKRKIKRTSVHAMRKPFRKFKRIIRRGFKHPKRTFKKVLKAIILPKSAVGILTSSMFSNAVGFGSGSLAGMTAGSIAGGIASGIFRNFGSFGKNIPDVNSRDVRLADANGDLNVNQLPIAYLLANPTKDK